MASRRMAIGIVVGIILSLFSIGAFTMWQSWMEIYNYFGTDILKFFYVIMADNFHFDMISFFTSSTKTVWDFFAPAMLSWIFVGFVCGVIAKGARRGIVVALLVVIVDLLIWILLGIVSGEDVFNLFIDTNLITTLGGIISAIAGAVIGGVIGGATSGPFEGM